MLAILKNRVFHTIFTIALYTIFAPYLSLEIHRGLYTISVFIKDILILLMPITVGVFIASTIDSFEKKAPVFVLVLVLFESTSNLLSVYYSYFAGYIVSSELSEFDIVKLNSHFSALWRIPFTKPAWWGADKGCLVGLIVGCFSAWIGSRAIKKLLFNSRIIIESLLTKIFSKLIPVYVVGCIAQIYMTGLLSHIIVHYSILVLYLTVALIVYMFCIFAVGSGFKIISTIRSIKNLLPAGFVAFTSTCSISTMPWTIHGASQNLKDPNLAKVIIPATTNIQQIGDCITNAFLCFLIYKNFFGYNPDLLMWSMFTLVFVLTRFATAAVTGGAIFLMVPIYEHYLNFNDEMIAIILAMNAVLDPIITSSNVLSNGGLAKIFENVWLYVNRYFYKTKQ